MEDKIGIFIFRRDLRIEDNPALYMLFKKKCQVRFLIFDDFI